MANVTDTMPLIDLLRETAVARDLLSPDAMVDAAAAFALVRDMPYMRASDRQPETIIKEWRGTCSGKHYLLQRLFAELGIPSQVMACTTHIHIDPQSVPNGLRPLLEQTNGNVVDVHNYLLLQLPAGEMVVDATWPLFTKPLGFPVNDAFLLGESQQIACVPNQTWVVPEDRNPQDYKDELLAEHFSPDELAHRDKFIRTISALVAGGS